MTGKVRSSIDEVVGEGPSEHSDAEMASLADPTVPERPHREDAPTRLDGGRPRSSGSIELPVLLEDGVTVKFESFQQFLTQHGANISHGALAVRSRPLASGVQRDLTLSLPGVFQYELGATVVVSSGETVGFMIDSFGIHGPRLAILAAGNNELTAPLD
jgi:hypothetical protein